MLGSGATVKPDSCHSSASESVRNPKKASVDDSGPLTALEALSERDFQAHVVAGLRQRGWLVFVVPDMRKTLAGLPDILAIHAGRDVLLAYELKTMSGRVSPLQRAVIEIMAGIPGIDARVIRPSDWLKLKDTL